MIEIDDRSLSTEHTKKIAMNIVEQENVDKNALYTLAYGIPTALIAGFFLYLEKRADSLLMVGIYGILSGIIVSFFAVSFYMKIRNAMTTGEANLGFSFDMKKWIPILISGTIVSCLVAIGIYDTGILGSIISLIGGILSIPVYMIYYISVARDFTVGETIFLGLKYGFKYFFRLLILALSFIPLCLLIVLTALILGIWKGMYIETSYFVLCEKILKREGI